jgi:hypothetical protein
MLDDCVITIYIERAVDVVDSDRAYDPMAPYARPEFYAHVLMLSGDIPSEFEVRLSRIGTENEMTRIVPRQLDETGELYFPTEALETAIDKIRERTAANERTQAERVGVTVEGEAEEG